MLLAVILLIVGAVVLIAGAESAVRGTARFATLAGVPAFVLGALLFGIDFEGLGAALLAAGRGQTAIAAGEAFGTVMFLFGVGFAFALLLSRGSIKAPAPLMVALPAVCVAAAALVVADQYVTRAEGLWLLVLYAVYVWVVVAQRAGVDERARELEREGSEIPGGRGRAAVIALFGLGAVYVGAWVLVQGGIRIVERTGLAAGFVGAAVIGSLSALDEVFLEVLPVMRGAPELATGNLFGTVAAFSTVVIGLAALIHPLLLDAAAQMSFLAAAALYAIVATAFLVRGELSKPVGFVLLAAYVAWLGYTVTL
jgi:cation:H+ antiporter